MADILILAEGAEAPEAARLLPQARILPAAWHAEAGLLWIEADGAIRAVPFKRLLVLVDQPRLLAALGCAFRGGIPAVDAHGETSVPGIFAAGPALGVTGAPALAQLRLLTQVLNGEKPEGLVAALPRMLPAVERADPVAIAGLIEDGEETLLLAQMESLGPLHFAMPVGLAALAGFADAPPPPGPRQSDAEPGA